MAPHVLGHRRDLRCVRPALTEGNPPIALSQSVVSELLDAFRVGDGVDLIRESVRMVIQELIEAGASDQLGAARYQRTESRTTDRNGSRARRL